MTTITFELTDSQAAEAERLRASRVDIADINELCRVEVVYSLSLTDEKIAEKEKAVIVMNYDKLLPEDREKVLAIFDKVADADVGAVVVP